jgi:hypothetical protein
MFRLLFARLVVLSSLGLAHGINRQGKFLWRPTSFKYKSLQDVQARAQEKKDEEVPTPLTEEERSSRVQVSGFGKR